ncbi:hypothetical protein PR048_027664 [Dryococelus australis]|uniref:Fibronectin type-III domain-containing protein n=1 Tax=Dryococelus australis TaxID=614101 RepID=A0ABQ9GH58_9NEOP|nr:hypothetical protein PR048_027664 [Dryococelus australis]
MALDPALATKALANSQYTYLSTAPVVYTHGPHDLEIVFKKDLTQGRGLPRFYKIQYKVQAFITSVVYNIFCVSGNQCRLFHRRKALMRYYKIPDSIKACARSAIAAVIWASVAPVIAFPALYGQISFHTGSRTWSITLQFQNVGRSPRLLLETSRWRNLKGRLHLDYTSNVIVRVAYEQKDGDDPWTSRQTRKLEEGSDIVTTNITGLLTWTYYSVRVLLIDIDLNSYEGDDVPYTTVRTSCVGVNNDFTENVSVHRTLNAFPKVRMLPTSYMELTLQDTSRFRAYIWSQSPAFANAGLCYVLPLLTIALWYLNRGYRSPDAPTAVVFASLGVPQAAIFKPCQHEYVLNLTSGPRDISGKHTYLKGRGPETLQTKPQRVASSAGMLGRGERKIPEKIHRPAASFGTIPTCENPGVTPPRIESGSPRREATKGEVSYVFHWQTRGRANRELNPIRLRRRVAWPLHHRGPEHIVPEQVEYYIHSSDVRENSFQVSWLYEQLEDWCPLKYFEVYLKDSWRWVVYDRTTEHSANFTDLLAGKKHRTKVRAVTVRGSTKYSKSIVVVTGDQGIAASSHALSTAHCSCPSLSTALSCLCSVPPVVARHCVVEWFVPDKASSVMENKLYH